MLPRGALSTSGTPLAPVHHDAPEAHHALFLHRLADHRECLVGDLVVRHDVEGLIEIDLVHFVARDERLAMDVQSSGAAQVAWLDNALANEQEVLAEWVQLQLSASTLRSDLMKESELRMQCSQFLKLMRQASQTAGPEFKAKAWDRGSLPLARSEVVFAGQPIVLVVAESDAAARDALVERLLRRVIRRIAPA